MLSPLAGQVGVLGRAARVAAPSTLNNNLVAYYKFADLANIAVDSKGSNHGTNNSCTVATGKQGNGAVWSGSDGTQRIVIPDSADFVGGANSFEWSGWVKTTNGGRSGGFAFGNIFAKRIVGNEYFLQLNGTGNVRWWLSTTGGVNAGNKEVNIAGALTDNVWSLVNVFFDAAAAQIGVSINGGTPSVTNCGTNAADTTGSHVFGAQNTSNQEVYSGMLDEWGRWSRVLTSAERTELYNGGSGKTYPF